MKLRFAITSDALALALQLPTSARIISISPGGMAGAFILHIDELALPESQDEVEATPTVYRESARWDWGICVSEKVGG